VPVLGQLETYLVRRKVKMTRDRGLVFMAMSAPVSMNDLLPLLPKTSAYRTINLFMRIGVAYESQPGIYELTDLFAPHRHYKVCRNCGRRLAFNSPALERALAREDHREQELGFVVEGHTLEFTGVCGLCRSTAFPHTHN
jgi:Fe2+ or Zn2+ uptake regulation protein